jgi:hypothetical protein
MRKIIFAAALTIAIAFNPKNIGVRADVITYPFDEIKIVSAYRYEVLVDVVPGAPSKLNGLVLPGENVFIYIGELKFYQDGLEVSGSDSIMIVTNETNVEISTCLINSYGSDLTTYRTYGYASWITINPTVGIVKDFTLEQYELSNRYDIVNDTYQFTDNALNDFPMVAGTLLVEPVVDITISAFVGE